MVVIFNACPKCNKHFVYSSLLEKTGSHFKLYCLQCKTDYELPNVETQRGLLSNGSGGSSQIEPLVDICQLSRGDAIFYNKIAEMFEYIHHAIVKSVDYDAGSVEVIEFAPVLPLKNGFLLRVTRDFNNDIKLKNAYIRRYMPLDCLPAAEVVGKADAMCESPPPLHLDLANCEHLSSECKTGNRDSSVTKWHQFNLDGHKGYSIIEKPGFFIGDKSYSPCCPCDTFECTEFDVVNTKIKKPWEQMAVPLGKSLLGLLMPSHS